MASVKKKASLANLSDEDMGFGATDMIVAVPQDAKREGFRMSSVPDEAGDFNYYDPSQDKTRVAIPPPQADGGVAGAGAPAGMQGARRELPQAAPTPKKKRRLTDEELQRELARIQSQFDTAFATGPAVSAGPQGAAPDLSAASRGPSKVGPF